ncbi:uncharacterized protein LOC134840516 [Symsagittifera roscoffensis]|uniref:uncharacterized protein LOC134840516 n=1 Tax=Symsagittifera roscoffensis TaxID=84072 RepID=UPI00307B393C
MNLEQEKDAVKKDMTNSHLVELTDYWLIQKIKKLTDYESPLKPVFLTELVKYEISLDTFSPENSSAKEIDLQSVYDNLENDLFLEEIEHIINYHSEHNRHFLSTIQTQISKTSTFDLKIIHGVELIPVKKLKIDYQVIFKNHVFDGKSEKYLHVEAKDKKCRIIFTCIAFSEATKEKNILREVTSALLQYCGLTNLDTPLTDLLTKFIFECSDNDSRRKLLEIHKIPLLNSAAFQQTNREDLIGRKVPKHFESLIEHDPYRRFRPNDFVAVKQTPDSEDHSSFFVYGRFLNVEIEAKWEICQFPILQIQVDKDEVKNISGSIVSAFKEKVEKKSKFDRNFQEELEKDVDYLFKVFCTFISFSDSDDDDVREKLDVLLERAKLSIFSKYSTFPSLDGTGLLASLINRVENQWKNKNIPNTLGQINEPEDVVRSFFEHDLEKLQARIEINQRKFEEAGRVLGSKNRNDNSVDLMVRGVEMLNKQHPKLAKLWLKQAEQDAEVLYFLWKRPKRKSNMSWIADCALKIIQNSLSSISVLNHGGVFVFSNELSRANLRRLEANFESGGEKKDVLEVIEQLNLMTLHRPDRGQELTSRETLSMDFIIKAKFSAEKTLSMAKNVIESSILLQKNS